MTVIVEAGLDVIEHQLGYERQKILLGEPLNNYRHVR